MNNRGRKKMKLKAYWFLTKSILVFFVMIRNKLSILKLQILTTKNIYSNIVIDI